MTHRFQGRRGFLSIHSRPRRPTFRENTMSDFYNLPPPDSGIQGDRRNGAVPSAAGGTLVTFFEYEEFQSYKSKVEGRKIFEKKDYIRKIADDKSEFCRRMRESDKDQFPQQWAAYIANKDSQGIIGTMLDDYAKASGNLNGSQLEMLRGNRVFTVEQLSQLSDVHMQNIGSGVRKMRTEASVWLEELKAGSVERELMAKLAEVEAKYESTIENLKGVDPEKDKKELELAQSQNQTLQEMNKEILEQYKALAAEVAELKADKKPKAKAKARK